MIAHKTIENYYKTLLTRSMFNPENRYKELGNSKKRDLNEIKSILSDPSNALDFFFANADEFNEIVAIDNADNIDDFKRDNYKAISSALQIVKDLSSFDNPGAPVKIYRGILLGPEDVEPDLALPGMCWTNSEQSAEDFVAFYSDDLIDDPDYAECILTAEYKTEDIDWVYSVALMLDELKEKEIRIYKDADPISIDYNVL